MAAMTRTSILILSFEPTGTNFLFLQDAQQLGLHLKRQFADFIEEDGATIRCREQSLLGLDARQ